MATAHLEDTGSGEQILNEEQHEKATPNTQETQSNTETVATHAIDTDHDYGHTSEAAKPNKKVYRVDIERKVMRQQDPKLTRRQKRKRTWTNLVRQCYNSETKIHKSIAKRTPYLPHNRHYWSKKIVEIIPGHDHKRTENILRSIRESLIKRDMVGFKIEEVDSNMTTSDIPIDKV